MYRYGIVSTASITSRFITGLRLAKDEVICIGSRDINKAREFAEKNDIENYYGSYEEVYRDPNVDIVYIPVINNLHFECAKDALLCGKNVVLEKPFTITVQQASELYDLAKRNNCFLFEGVKNLFVPSTKFVEDNLNKLGKISNIVTTQGTKKPFPEGHWMYDASKGGGAYYGSAAYVYHYLCFLFKSKVTNLDGTYIPCDKSDLICNFTFNLNEISVNSTIDLSKDLDNTCVIYGDKGKMIIHEFWRSHFVEVILDDGKRFEFKDDGNEFVYEARHIHDCLDKRLLQSPIIGKQDSIDEVTNIDYLYRKWDLI